MGCAVLTSRMIQNGGQWVEGVEMVFVTPFWVAPGVLLVIDCPRMSDQGAQTLAHATVHWKVGFLPLSTVASVCAAPVAHRIITAEPPNFPAPAAVLRQADRAGDSSKSPIRLRLVAFRGFRRSDARRVIAVGPPAARGFGDAPGRHGMK